MPNPTQPNPTQPDPTRADHLVSRHNHQHEKSSNGEGSYEVPFNDKLRLILIKQSHLRSPEADTLFRALSTSDATMPFGTVRRQSSGVTNKYQAKRVKTLKHLRRLTEDDPNGRQGHLFGYIFISVPKPAVPPQPVARSMALAPPLFWEGDGEGGERRKEGEEGGRGGEEEGAKAEGLGVAAGAARAALAPAAAPAASQVVKGAAVKGSASLQAEKRKAEAPLERRTSRRRSGAGGK